MCKYYADCLTCPFSDCVNEVDIKLISLPDLEELRRRIPYTRKEYSKVNARIYYLKNREKIAARTDKYYYENRDKVLKVRKRRWETKHV